MIYGNKGADHLIGNDGGDRIIGGAGDDFILGDKGYDKLFGARPLARLIQEHIKKPLANELLFGKLAKGGIVKVSVKDGELDFAFKSPPPKDKNNKKLPVLVE